jgi:RES domain-containing protein
LTEQLGVGLTKQAWIEAQERGWSAPDDRFVCPDCVEDAYLKEFIREHVAETACSYCGRSETEDIAAPLEELMQPIAGAVEYHFNDPTDAGVPWDEGAFAIEPTSTEDVLLSLPLECDDDLFADVAGCFSNDSWVRAAGGHWSSSHEHEVLGDSWSSFVSTVRHETRFHFHLAPPSPVAGPQEFAPGSFLPVLGRLIDGSGLVRSIAASAPMFRVRLRAKGDAWEPAAEQLGAPPLERARAGRMNPAGIPYLYVALDEATALAETVSSPPVEAVIATFKASRQLTVIDLTDLPPLPSVFDERRRMDREGLLFLRAFVREISKPVTKDGAEHVDYVPSQVVCEYIAQVFRPRHRAGRIDGLLYPSAVRPGGKNLVLFPSERGWARRFDSVSFVSADVRQLNDWSDLVGALDVRSRQLGGSGWRQDQ